MMTNKILIILIFIAIAVIAFIIVCQKISQKPEITKQELLQKFQTLKTQYEQAKAKGYDVSEVERLGRESKQAFDKGDYKRANELLEEAKSALEKIKTSKTPPTITPTTPTSCPQLTPPSPQLEEECKKDGGKLEPKKDEQGCYVGYECKKEMPQVINKEEARKKLSQVKVASLYESITDGAQINRDMNDVVEIFKETHTDLIFRGFWRWIPVPESPDSISPELLQYIADAAKLNPNQIPEMMRASGRSYEQLTNSISTIKKEMPDIIFVGAIPAQKVNRIETNDVTGEIYESTWNMALDPQKWNLPKSKEETQQQLQKMLGFKNDAYFPDITNPDFQKLLLSWAQKQIDSGADAIWIDMLFSQPRMLKEISGDTNHPAVKESYEAASKIVDEIHAYGYAKYNKYIYVGTWWTFAELPYSPPDVDFVTASPSSKEIKEKSLDESGWNDIMNQIKVKIGDTPVFAFIDWGGTNSPTVVFSQTLTPAQQREFLITADDFFTKKGIIFVYPVHGGFMGGAAEKLSFGKSKNYDSLAPEFNTYETIKELANNKAAK